MVSVGAITGRHPAQQLELHRQRGGPHGQPGAVTHPEDVGVYGHGFFAEGTVQHDIGGLAAHARQALKRLA